MLVLLHKEKERKLEQLSNKRRKEEFYRQWLELEPVAEVDDEEDHDENDSALSSAPSSMSPQPGGCGQWQSNSVTREAYEAVLIEIEELQSKLLREQRELSRARIQVCDLEKALSQQVKVTFLKLLDRSKHFVAWRERARTITILVPLFVSIMSNQCYSIRYSRVNCYRVILSKILICDVVS